MVELTANARALVVTLLFYTLYMGYMFGMMRYHAKYPTEAILAFTFLAVLFFVSAALFLSGRRYGFIGIMALSVFTIILQSPTLIHETTTGQTETGIPIALDAWFAAIWLLMYLFPLLTLILSIRAYREA